MNVETTHPHAATKQDRLNKFAKFLINGFQIDEIAQAIRRAHCADHKTHECVGMCIIRKDGILLSCKKCGHEFNPEEKE